MHRALLLSAAAHVLAAAALRAGNATSNATFTYGTFTAVMVGWDPATDYSNEIIAMNNMYETLTRYDAKTEKVEPLLATKWSSADGGKTWTFTIRYGVKFHTGRPLTPGRREGRRSSAR